MYCCETAGFTRGCDMNHLSKTLSMNVLRSWSIAFIPVTEEIGSQTGKWFYDLPTHQHCQDVSF
jgi:hypothetical protein